MLLAVMCCEDLKKHFCETSHNHLLFLSLYDTIKIECVLLHRRALDASPVGLKEHKYHWSTTCPGSQLGGLRRIGRCTGLPRVTLQECPVLVQTKDQIVCTSYEDESCMCLKLCSTVLACVQSWLLHATTSIQSSALSLAWHCRPQEASLRERWPRQSALCSDSIIAVTGWCVQQKMYFVLLTFVLSLLPCVISGDRPVRLLGYLSLPSYPVLLCCLYATCFIITSVSR